MTATDTPTPSPESVPPAGFEAIGFPHVARLELDELLEQLIARARDVQATQGRLRGPLRAYHTVASTVDLDEVLQHIVAAARTLVDASYAALGVVEQGRLVRFLHAGMDDETVRQIGHLPEGKGLLGRLIDYPVPLRLPAIAAHAASVGFPQRHPPMRSFLGVPIRVGQRVYGNLYLTDKRHADEFSSDDEELATALAAAAGAAITNAGALADAHRRQRWLSAMADLATAVFTSGDPEHAPEHVLRLATATVGCVGGSVVIPVTGSRFQVAAAAGILSELRGVTGAVDGTIYGQAMAERRTIVIASLAADPRSSGRGPSMAGPTVAVPVLTELKTEGVLFLCRHEGEAQFDAVDIEMLNAYAAHSALVLQLARTRYDNEQLRLSDDRQQIADDLQTEVIARLSRLAIELQGLAVRAKDRSLNDALQARVSDTDRILGALRTAIFALHPESDG